MYSNSSGKLSATSVGCQCGWRGEWCAVCLLKELSHNTKLGPDVLVSKHIGVLSPLLCCTVYTVYTIHTLERAFSLTSNKLALQTEAWGSNWLPHYPAVQSCPVSHLGSLRAAPRLSSPKCVEHMSPLPPPIPAAPRVLYDPLPLIPNYA